MGELGAGDVNGTRPSRVARIWRRSMWNPSETSSTRRLSLPANQRATPASEAYVLAPAGSATTAPAGQPNASSNTTAIPAVSFRRQVQKDMGGIYDGRSAYRLNQ